MTDLSSNVRFRNDLRAKLIGSYSDIVLKSEALRNLDVIKDLLKVCHDHNINSSDMRLVGVSPIEEAGMIELVSRDLAGRHYDLALSRLLNKLIPILLTRTENPFLVSLGDIQSQYLPTFQIQKDKKITFSARILSLKPFIGISLTCPAKKEHLLKIQFKIDVKATLTKLNGQGEKLQGTLVLDLYTMISKVSSPIGAQPVNLQLQNSKLELDFPFEN